MNDRQRKAMWAKKDSENKGWSVKIAKTTDSSLLKPLCLSCAVGDREKYSDYCKVCNERHISSDKKSYEDMMRRRGATNWDLYDER